MSRRRVVAMSLAWLGSAAAVAAAFGVLRWSAATTPIRAAGELVSTPNAVVEEPLVVETVAVDPPPPAETRSPAPRARPVHNGWWTYRKSKHKVITVERFEDIPEEFRSSAKRLP